MAKKPGRPRTGGAPRKTRTKPRPKLRGRSKAAIASEIRVLDPLQDLMIAGQFLLGMAIPAAWWPAVKANVEVLRHQAQLFDEFPLPDDAEPAPVFKA
jgi:1-carboxybiuret hydrolase subunit AtzG-like protein